MSAAHTNVHQATPGRIRLWLVSEDEHGGGRTSVLHRKAELALEAAVVSVRPSHARTYISKLGYAGKSSRLKHVWDLGSCVTSPDLSTNQPGT